MNKHKGSNFSEYDMAESPAFPSLETFTKFDDELNKDVEYTLPAGGLTKREYFIGCALKAMSLPILDSNPADQVINCEKAMDVAMSAEMYADAIIKALSSSEDR